MKSSTVIIERIKGIVAPILEDERLELVDIEFVAAGKRWVLRVFIDREGGVTIDDCAYVSRELSRVLDVEDVVDHAYTLEVSSPGLTRPLKRMEDFVRYRGKACRIVVRGEIDGRSDFRGEIDRVDADKVEIREKIGIVTIPICAIKKAHLDFEL